MKTAEIATKLLKRAGGVLPGFGVLTGYQARAAKIAAWLERDVEKDTSGDSITCLCCQYADRPKLAKSQYTVQAYDTPWDDAPRSFYFCSEDCRDAYMYDGDFRYIWCDACDRQICEQNPGNGWHGQFRDTQHGLICLSCYEKDILENGCDPQKIRDGQLPGMFFNNGNPELAKTGWEPVETDVFVTAGGTAHKRLTAAAVAVLDRGGKVILAHESMGIGGGEGYVSLYKKEK